MMKIYSPVFLHGDAILPRYTCDGLDISVPLAWQDLPPNAASLSLIMDDPDAPGGTWVHWVLYSIVAEISAMDENQARENRLANGALQGLNSWGQIGYGGPCPPSGSHRYFFKLYALDMMVAKEPGLTKTQLLTAMQSHILAEVEMVGTYQRKR